MSVNDCIFPGREINKSELKTKNENKLNECQLLIYFFMQSRIDNHISFLILPKMRKKKNLCIWQKVSLNILMSTVKFSFNPIFNVY